MNPYVPLPGSRRLLLPNSRPAGPIDLSTITTITVRVRSAGNVEALEKMVLTQSQLPLKDRKYFTRKQLAEQFGAKPQDLDAVEGLAQKHNLAVVHRSSADRSIVLKGTLGDLLDAFPADVQMFHHANGTYRGRRGEIHIPPSLSGIVTGIFGFDTRPKHRSPHSQKIMAASGPGANNGVSATFFANRYAFPTEIQGRTLDGSGQTIAIVELGGGFRSTDLALYFREIGVSMPRVVSVSVDQLGNAPTTAGSADSEVMLDIEVAGAVAPKATLVVYFAPNDGDKGFLDAIRTAIYDAEHDPSVISISWGAPETSTDKQGIDAYHELFTAAASLGITVCAASGDHGAAGLAADQWDGKLHVNHPAADDFVLGCGGTQIDENNDVAWNDETPFDVTVEGGGGWATGGGISTIFAVPTYQANANLPVSLATGQSGRGVPDIAMSATNYFTRVDGSEGASGGTSAVAPLMAALVALLNQAKQSKVGFLNPFLYSNAGNGLFKDVSVGSNAIKDKAPGYNAASGWDACTGLGVPIGMALLNKL